MFDSLSIKLLFTVLAPHSLAPFDRTQGAEVAHPDCVDAGTRQSLIT